MANPEILLVTVYYANHASDTPPKMHGILHMAILFIMRPLKTTIVLGQALPTKDLDRLLSWWLLFYMLLRKSQEYIPGRRKVSNAGCGGQY